MSRRTLVRIHLWLGITIGFFWALQGLTGALLVFSRDVDRAVLGETSDGPVLALDDIFADAEFATQAKVTKLDVDANIKTATRFNVRSIPMLLFFKGGKVVDQIVGAVPRQTIEAKLKQHVA